MLSRTSRNFAQLCSKQRFVQRAFSKKFVPSTSYKSPVSQIYIFLSIGIKREAFFKKYVINNFVIDNIIIDKDINI